MRTLLAATVVSFLGHLASSATVSYNWDITWVQVNPDGRQSRRAVGVNGQWPCPAITANVGDQVTINVNNKLGTESTSLHFHGLYQNGTNSQDGPVGVTQCPIPPGSSYTYSFTINQPGTYWWHSHSPGQYTDGLRGPIIVHDPSSPYAGQYDDELVLTVADWYHDEAPGLISTYLSPSANPDGAEPVPYSALLNEAQGIKLMVKPGKTYFLRVINMAAFSQAYLHFDQHNFTIIEADGIYTKPQSVSDLYVATAQRYGVLLKTKDTASQNFAFLASLDTDKFDNVPGYLNPNATGYLVYDSSKPLPAQAPTVSGFNVFDDFGLTPWDGQKLLGGKPGQSIVLNLDFFDRDGQNRAGFNNITYLMQKVPTLYTTMTTGKQASDPTVYGVNANAFVVSQGQLVELVINNFDGGSHPMHLHGHAAQIVVRNPGVWTPPPKHKDQKNPSGVTGSATKGYTGDTSTMPQVPMRRDTFLLAPLGYTVLRFQATNPGVWLLHCHMEWHVEAGLTATIIEAPQQLQAQQKLSDAMTSICKAQGIPVAGNAAGNTANFTDLTGANTVAPAPRGALYP